MAMLGRVVHGDCLYWLDDVKPGSVDLVYIDPPFFTQKSWGDFDDRWPSRQHYLDWMREVLYKLKVCLKDAGSILLHCDWRMSHRLRCLLDDVFGEKNFINEIIWCYKSGGASQKKCFSRKHDNIFLYSKGKKYTYNPMQEKSYNRGLKPYKFKGVKEFKDDVGWHTLVNQKDVLNFDMIGRTSKERIGYRTQKPESLLKRLIEACSNKGDLVLDCFGGSGTTAAVAYKLGRDFIVGDKNPRSIYVIKKRLDDLGVSYG